MCGGKRKANLIGVLLIGSVCMAKTNPKNDEVKAEALSSVDEICDSLLDLRRRSLDLGAHFVAYIIEISILALLRFDPDRPENFKWKSNFLSEEELRLRH